MRYPGGKNVEWRRVVNRIPPHRVYVEPFLGSGAVLRHKRAAERSIGLDTDPEAIGAVRAALGDRPDVELRCDDGIDYLDGLAARRPGPAVCVYADPPYLPETRTKRIQYGPHELTRDDHVRLLAIVRRLGCRVLLSGYPSELYAEALVGWRVYQFRAMTRGGVPRTECLWMNYPEPAELHDPSQIGETWREREKYRKQQRRWRDRLRRMGPLQRQALLAAIEEEGT